MCNIQRTRVFFLPAYARTSTESQVLGVPIFHYIRHLITKSPNYCLGYEKVNFPIGRPWSPRIHMDINGRMLIADLAHCWLKVAI